MLVRDDGSICRHNWRGCVEAEVWQAAREVMESEKPRTLTFDLNQDPKYDTGPGVRRHTRDFRGAGATSSGALHIWRRPRITSLYKVARIAGFDITVIDDREVYASRERFPEGAGSNRRRL